MLAAVTNSTPNPELPNDFGEAPNAPTGGKTAPSDEADSAPSSPLLREIQASDDERRRREFERAGGALFPSKPASGGQEIEGKSDTPHSPADTGSVVSAEAQNQLFVTIGDGKARP